MALVALCWLLGVCSGLSTVQQQQQQQSRFLTKLELPSFEPPSSSSDGKAKQNAVGRWSDWMLGGVFRVLHAFDESGIEDSSKNLRVLWARAALDAAGEIDDKIASELLPPTTRGVAAWPVWRPVVAGLAEFVTARTRFIDSKLDAFISSSGPKPRVVIVGAGFDTRSLRYSGLADFVEVDNVKVIEGKATLWRKQRKEEEPPKFVACDLNAESLGQKLSESGVEPSSKQPTLFIVEAVLFYVDDQPTRRVFEDILNWEGASLTIVDSLAPLVSSPFEHDVARLLLEERGWHVHDHDSRWGGAVHFLSASKTPVVEEGAKPPPPSYFPLLSSGAASKLSQPSFENAWYAVGYSWQIDEREETSRDGASPFSTRLFGEPLVLYRDSADGLVCVPDACPHRAAPLSMGRVKNGELACVYHGWRFGKDGHRTDVHDAKCRATTYPVEERDGLVFVWHGEEAEADTALLPSSARRRPGSHHVVDTVLDYKLPFEYVVENNLDSLHLFYLHDGSIPPIAGLGMTRTNVDYLKTAHFKDCTGIGHVGRVDGLRSGKPNNLVRFDAPNVVRHGGANFHEEFHVIPVAPKRCRVLLRQHIPKGPILSAVLKIPGAAAAVRALVRNWNYHISLEDYSVMVGQANTIDTLGAPRMNRAGPGDDLIAKFYQWRDRAIQGDQRSPYFMGWTPETQRDDPSAWSHARARRPSGSDVVVDPVYDENPKDDVFFGLKEIFNPVHPVADFPPANPKPYLPLWQAHSIALAILGNPEFEKPVSVEHYRKKDANPPSTKDSGSSSTAATAAAAAVPLMKNVTAAAY